MGHKTLIGGTAYEITGGKTLVGGTAYSIDKGKTLVGGTAYEVGFDDGMRTITTEKKNSDCAEIDSREYPEIYFSGQYIVPVGTIITCSVCCESEDEGVAKVVINGETVLSSRKNTSWKTYDYTVTEDAVIIMDTVNGAGLITITEE